MAGACCGARKEDVIEGSVSPSLCAYYYIYIYNSILNLEKSNNRAFTRNAPLAQKRGRFSNLSIF